MRQIDLETWPRRELFRLFSTWDYPHFNMCANVDLTAFHPFLKEHSISFTVAIIYTITRAANAIPEFRYRLQAGRVVEHEIVHPSTTILTNDDLFGFCQLPYTEDFSAFAARAAKKIAFARKHLTVKDNAGQDNLLYMTAIPWVSFTSFMHPIDLSPVDSVPRFAWGKFFEEGKSMKMPLSVQAHHALMDGIHMGRFYAIVQDYLHHPGTILNGV